MYYREREPGMNIYSINDTTGRYFPEPYCLESFDNTPEYFMTIEEAVRYVSGMVRKRVFLNMKAINNVLNEYMRLLDNQDMLYPFHEIKVVK